MFSGSVERYQWYESCQSYESRAQSVDLVSYRSSPPEAVLQHCISAIVTRCFNAKQICSCQGVSKFFAIATLSQHRQVKIVTNVSVAYKMGNFATTGNGLKSLNFVGKLCSLHAAQKMKFSVKDFFSKCDKIRRKLRIWSHLMKKSLIRKLYFLCSYTLEMILPMPLHIT